MKPEEDYHLTSHKPLSFSLRETEEDSKAISINGNKLMRFGASFTAWGNSMQSFKAVLCLSSRFVSVFQSTSRHSARTPPCD